MGKETKSNIRLCVEGINTLTHELEKSRHTFVAGDKLWLVNGRSAHRAC